MKRFIFSGIIIAIIYVPFFANDFDDMKSKVGDISSDLATQISTAMAPNFGYYTGSGNVTPVNTSSFLGLKIGVGLGLNLTPNFFSAMNNIESAIPGASSDQLADSLKSAAGAMAAIPSPYDLLYVKIGVPIIPLDVGLRIGVIPALSFGTSDGSVGIGGFHFGVEGRYSIFELPAGLIKVDARVSYDYDGGNINVSAKTTQDADINGKTIGSNNLTMAWNMGWSGSSIGAKLMGGLNIPLIGGLYLGLGMNINIGQFSTEVKTDYDFGPNGTGTSEGLTEQKFTVDKTASAGYNAFDLRLIGGVQIFFINAAVEYGILNGNYAITFIPFSMVF